MKQVVHDEGSRPIHIWTDDIEAGALQQLKNIAKLPFVHKHGVAAMPDVHWGIGATVGSVIATQYAIIPAAVGVDIGCGMNAVRTSLTASDLPDWAQDYAAENRRVMMEEVIRNLRHHIPLPFEITHEAINCHHNYVERENHFGENLWVTRKGAIRARAGDLGIIPGSMGARSYIVRGKGNAASYHSCSHGAGRKYGRKDAMRRFTVEDLIAQTEGVECLKNASVLDEIPSAYKDIDVVMANQADLVEVVHTLKQVLCVKGA